MRDVAATKAESVFIFFMLTSIVYPTEQYKCDPFRPCSLCVRANVECSSSSINLPSGAPKRKRTRDPSCDDSQPSHQRPSIHATCATPSLFRPEEQHPVHHHGGSGSSRETDIDATMDAESRRQSVADGEADSAVGIAHKVHHFGSRTAFSVLICDLFHRSTS